MIQAEFQKKRFTDIVCILCGFFLLGLFVFVGYVDNEATFGNVLTGIFLGGFCCVWGFLLLLYNFRAYLLVEDDCIKGKFHYCKKLDCRISDVDFVSAGYNTLTLQLKSGKCYKISGVRNAWEFASALRKLMRYEVCDESDLLIQEWNRLKAVRKKGILSACIGLILMFLNIFIAVFLTHGKEMDAFNRTDWTVMAIMGVVELITVIATFYLAGKTGRYNVPIDKLQFDIQRTLVYTTAVLPGNAIKVFTDENFLGRLTVCGYPNDEAVYYVVEEFTPDLALIKIYESEVYRNLEELPDGFEALTDITEKVLL